MTLCYDERIAEGLYQETVIPKAPKKKVDPVDDVLCRIADDVEAGNWCRNTMMWSTPDGVKRCMLGMIDYFLR